MRWERPTSEVLRNALTIGDRLEVTLDGVCAQSGNGFIHSVHELKTMFGVPSEVPLRITRVEARGGLPFGITIPESYFTSFRAGRREAEQMMHSLVLWSEEWRAVEGSLLGYYAGLHVDRAVVLSPNSFPDPDAEGKRAAVDRDCTQSYLVVPFSGIASLEMIERPGW